MNFWKSKSLQQKITWVILVPALTTLLLAVALLVGLESNEFEESLHREMNSIAGVVSANSKAALEFSDAASAAQNLLVLRDDPRILACAIYNESGTLFASYYRSANSQPLPALRARVGLGRGEHVLVVAQPVIHQQKEIGSIVVVASDREVVERLLHHFFVGALILSCSALAAYFLSLKLRNVIAKPILNLADVASAVSRHNDYSLRALKESDDETGLLVDQFNQMLHEIGRKSEALRASEDQLRLITDSLPVLISYVDNEQHYVFNNAAYGEFFQCDTKSLKGQHIRAVIGEKSYAEVEGYVRNVLQGSMQKFEHTMDFPAKGRRYVAATMVPNIQRGSVQGFFTLATDITDRKVTEVQLRVLNEALEERVRERTKMLEESQERLRQSERLASIGTLAAGVAHEIRNPLNSILLATQVVGRYEKELTPAVQKVIDGIGNEAKRCATIIKNILLFAKAERTERTRTDLNELVRHSADLASSYAPTRKPHIEMQLQSDALPVEVNTTEIEQVLLNLMSNAIESTDEGVTIQIQTAQQNGHAKLSITDDGPGIPADIINRIFDPFFSTKRQRGNTGLGLSLSHGIIADHRGSMSVESRPGKTTFVIMFPRSQS